MLLVAPLFALALCGSCSDDEDTVYIYNIDDLLDLQERVNDGNYDLNGVLMADLDMSGVEWEPIGYSSWYPFCATFNGNGFTISNLTISTAASYQGLIGVAYEANIKNVKLKDPQIKAGRYVGALCGYIVEDSTVSNCSVEGGSIEGYSTVGGLVGEAYYTDFGDCWSSATVTSEAHHVGGVVATISASTIDNCYNTGTINGSWHYIGGVIGSASDSEVSGCYNSGDVIGDVDNSNHVGGVVGNSIYYISACYNTGSVSGGSYVGGIVGSSMAIYDSYMDSPSIIGCYNTGAISATQYPAAIAGRTLSSTEIEACYFVDDSSTQVAAWEDDGTGVLSSSDSGATSVSSISALNSAVATLNSAIESYIYASGEVDVAFRYTAGSPAESVSPTLYRY